MNEIAILYSLARSGGTLISKCLGCIPGNILLSEINPRWAYFNPLDQAKDWFRVIHERDILALKDSGNYNYPGAIKLISDRCSEKCLNLVIRDWTHVDFIPGNYPVSPVYKLSRLEIMQKGYEVRHIALTRHPVDTFLSLARLSDYRVKIRIVQYLYGARAYAEAAASVGFVRFEDLCLDPDAALENICNTLHQRFLKYITGIGLCRALPGIKKCKKIYSGYLYSRETGCGALYDMQCVDMACKQRQ